MNKLMGQLEIGPQSYKTFFILNSVQSMKFPDK